MSDEVRVGSIDIHNVNRENITCEVHNHDYFATIQIKLSNTDITLFTTLDEVAAIRRILGGW